MSDIVHPFLGPLLIITYALLSNTLLLTVLVAILGNTFATINADAAAEVSYPSRDPGVELTGSRCFEKLSLHLKVSKQVRHSAEMISCDLESRLMRIDAVFSYQLPFNLVAVVFMWPMSYILNPRW